MGDKTDRNECAACQIVAADVSIWHFIVPLSFYKALNLRTAPVWPHFCIPFPRERLRTRFGSRSRRSRTLVRGSARSRCEIRSIPVS
jgi:hypothetical protein